MHRERKTTLVILIVVAFVASCKVQSQSPTETYRSFYAAAKKRDGAAIKMFFTKSSLPMFEAKAKSSNQSVDDYMAQVLGPMITSKLTEEIRNEKTNDKRSSFDVRMTTGGWLVLMLIKEDGSWKIISPL
jgi:hypothetical protein